MCIKLFSPSVDVMTNYPTADSSKWCQYHSPTKSPELRNPPLPFLVLPCPLLAYMIPNSKQAYQIKSYKSVE